MYQVVIRDADKSSWTCGQVTIHTVEDVDFYSLSFGEAQGNYEILSYEYVQPVKAVI